ncbi:MAG TPA: ubiquinone/menaquinone biosynthesis methyltransferase [Gemmatimonadales bacterium]|nr:ubiquinone/menaquinone biosynthesis methyltransferase [Gemmatimonadales bacterium]
MPPSPPTLIPLAGDAKRTYVRQMFTAIAPHYDRLNHLLSFNVDRRWRRRAVDALAWWKRPKGVYLDVCSGTLDLALELVARRGFAGRAVGADFVVPMLRLGRGKGVEVEAVGADALELPFSDARFDGCTVGFGVRNLSDVDRGLREIRRVLKPGARLVILDFAIPTAWPVRSIYLLYFRRVLPVVGRMVSKHMTAYSYLPDSVEGFLSPERLASRLLEAGFAGVAHVPLSLGVAALVWGEVP